MKKKSKKGGLSADLPRSISTRRGAASVTADELAIEQDARGDLATSSAQDPYAVFGDSVETFCDALVDVDPAAARRFADSLFKRGRSHREIVEYFIPAAARALGERWEADTLSFSLVTIGAARLQELAQSLNRRPRDGVAGLLDTGPTILIATPPSEQHSLGALIAASTLRRQGFDTLLEFDLQPARFAQIAQRTRLTAVGLSCSGVRNNLDAVSSLVDNLRAQSNFEGVIAIGGAGALDADLDLKSATGADLVTDDLRRFAAYCSSAQ